MCGCQLIINEMFYFTDEYGFTYGNSVRVIIDSEDFGVSDNGDAIKDGLAFVDHE